MVCTLLIPNMMCWFYHIMLYLCNMNNGSPSKNKQKMTQGMYQVMSEGEVKYEILEIFVFKQLVIMLALKLKDSNNLTRP